MGGLFSGAHKPAAVYTAAVPEEVRAQNAKKGATDLEKLTGKNERRKSYEADIIGDMGRTLGGDTTLASGSLLSLGNTLGQ